MVENGLIRYRKWLIDIDRCSLSFSLTKQSHLFLVFVDFGPLWDEILSIFLIITHFTPLEMVENGLIRYRKWLIDIDRCSLRFSLTKQSDSFLVFVDLGPLWDEILSIFLIITHLSPLEMVENGLIRYRKWLIDIDRCSIRFSMTKQSHLYLFFVGLGPLGDEILSIFLIITSFTPWKW